MTAARPASNAPDDADPAARPAPRREAPADPAAPENPAHPADSGAPDDGAADGESPVATDATDASGTTVPDASADPEKPDNANDPDDYPADPAGPENPDDAAAPDEPAASANPDTQADANDQADDPADPAGPDDPDDETWTEAEDDRTAETLAWLHAKRRAHRRKKSRDAAVLVYSLLLAALGYGSSFAITFLRGLEDGNGYADAARDLRLAMPALFCALSLALGLLSARDALWRGPVVVPAPAVGWLLAQPVRRAAVLRPWFRLSAGLALLPGLLAGIAAAAVLRVTGLATIGAAALAVLPAAVCLPLLAVSLGMAVERRPGLTRAVRRFTAPAVVVLGALAAQTVLAGYGHRVPVLERVELWSGPWGWAGQPVVHAAGGGAPGWPAAVALLAAATAAAVVHAYRDAGHVPTARLRDRAATATTVSSVMWSLELRAAKLAILDAGGDAPVRTVRLRPPRGRYGRHLVVAWRDLLTLLRAPGRLGKAAVWTACGTGIAALGADLGGERRVVGLVIGLLFGYFAVGALAEPARLETDDVRRSAWSPYRFRTLMLLHAIVPAVTGALLGLLAAVPLALNGTPWALLVLPLCAPPFTAAALYSACRGPARTQLLFVGGDSPIGSPGPLIYLAWYATGPLLSVTALTLALAPVARHADAAASAQSAMVAVLLSVLLLLLTTRSADRLLR